MKSLVSTLQERIAGRLSGLADLRGCASVLARQPKQTLNDIDAAIAQLKLGVFVFPPLFRQVRPNSTGLYAEEIEIRLSCFENPALNDTPTDVHRLIEIVLYHLHLWDPGLDNVTQLYATAAPVQDASTETLVVYDVVFTCSGGFAARPAHV